MFKTPAVWSVTLLSGCFAREIITTVVASLFYIRMLLIFLIYIETMNLFEDSFRASTTLSGLLVYLDITLFNQNGQSLLQ